MKLTILHVHHFAISLFLISVVHVTQAQNVGINATGAAPDASAILDVSSTSKGFLLPRVALTGTNAAGPVTSPATSLIVYNTATAGIAPNNVIPGYYYWNGTAWVALLNSTSNLGGWLLNGNAGTSGTTNFIGTTDNQQLVFKSDNASYLEMGTRTTLGLVQAFPDYTDGAERVTYLRSALQLDAPAAQFYKPKLWTDVDGNFRIKGSSAATDYFELGATGTNNAGGFEFIIGDDGDEPLLFKSYNYQVGLTEILRLQNGNAGIGLTAAPVYKLDVNGPIRTGSGSATNGSLVFSNSSNANTVTVNTGATTTSYALTLPTAQGAANSVLSNNGTGTLSWTSVAGSGGWSTTGNAGTTPSTNFLGTTDAQPLVFRVNNVNSARLETTASNNTFFGYQAAVSNTGTSNSALGTQALLANTTATNNTAVGASSLRATQTGGFNTGIGSSALIAATGAANTALGYQAGATNTTGGNNTFVGYQADATVNNLTNATAVGYNAKVASSNSLILGGTGANAVNVGVGNNTFDGTAPEKLLVDAGTTTSYNLMVGRGSINNYLQINVKNNSTGTSASSDLVATANNGSESTNFIDMGINGSGYTGSVMGSANDAYLYNLGQDLLIGAGSASRSLLFLTGGTLEGTNTRMTIDGTGNTSINNRLIVGGTTTATSTLQVAGSMATAITTVTGFSYTPTISDYTILTNNVLGVTVNLPTAASVSGRIYVIKRIYGGIVNTVIDPSGTEQIDGALTRNITAQNESVMIQSNGTAWFILARFN